MSPGLQPTSRRDLIKRLRQLGFEGPYSGGNHQVMARGDRTLRVPNPHGADISVGLLARILRQAGVSVAEWNAG